MQEQDLVKRGLNWYSIKSGSGPYQPRTCDWCSSRFFGKIEKTQPTYGRFCSVHCSRMGRGHAEGAMNPSWKADDITYISAHCRVRRRRGKADSCVWGCMDVARYEWANMTGDLANPDDYVGMCARCHRRFDQAIRDTAGIDKITDTPRLLDALMHV